MPDDKSKPVQPNTICVRCGEVVENGTSSAAQKVLGFCMTYNMSPRDLYIYMDQDIQDAFDELGGDAKDLITQLFEVMKTGKTSSSNKSKGNKGKKKNK